MRIASLIVENGPVYMVNVCLNFDNGSRKLDNGLSKHNIVYGGYGLAEAGAIGVF